MACVESGICFDTIVVIGVAESAFVTFDTGKRRTGADALFVQGAPHPRAIAAIIKRLWAWHKLGRPTLQNIRDHYQGFRQLENYEIVEAYEDGLSCIGNYAALVDRAHKKWPFPFRDALAAVMVRASKNSTLEQCAEFLEKLTTGANLDASDPVLRLREALIPRNGYSLTELHTAAYYAKAFQAFLDGSSIKVLRYAPDSEEFPKLKKSFNPFGDSDHVRP
jgi:hypothetical protein